MVHDWPPGSPGPSFCEPNNRSISIKQLKLIVSTALPRQDQGCEESMDTKRTKFSYVNKDVSGIPRVLAIMNLDYVMPLNIVDKTSREAVKSEAVVNQI